MIKRIQIRIRTNKLRIRIQEARDPEFSGNSQELVQCYKLNFIYRDQYGASREIQNAEKSLNSYNTCR
jgi:hypothetical protein